LTKKEIKPEREHRGGMGHQSGMLFGSKGKKKKKQRPGGGKKKEKPDVEV